jgi:2-haloacid dehalogenase
VTGLLRPKVVLFDVVETLASLAPVAGRLAEHGLDGGVLTRWFTRLLRDGIALTAAGGYAGFAEVATSALHAETRGALTDGEVQRVVGAFGELVPQPDAVVAVRAAREAGMRVFTLSNGAAASTQGFLERAGVADVVERVLSINEVRAWKPTRAPYEYAVREAGVTADRMALVAVHSWDIYGARRAGLTTGWCPRLEGAPTEVFGAADVTADALDGVVTGLAALPDRT